MNHINVQFIKTKIGELILGSFNDKLCLLDFKYRKMRKTIDHRISDGLKAYFIEREDEILKETKNQINEYLNRERDKFKIPILTVGTDFQKLVWEELRKVPYGTTSTYSYLASKINNPKAVRAVANANGANCINLIIPCHRIIGSNQELVGYGGGLPVKKYLLNLEKT